MQVYPSVFFVTKELLSITGSGFSAQRAEASKNLIQKTFQTIDLISIKFYDTVLHSIDSDLFNSENFDTFSDAAIYVIEKMSHGFNRLGKAHGKGFFNYDTDPPTLWSGLKVFEKRSFNIPEQDITDRLTFAAVIGALQTTEEEAASIDPEIKALIATRMAELAAAYGKRFADPRSAPPSAA